MLSRKKATVHNLTVTATMTEQNFYLMVNDQNAK